jgi:hypothetical protein
MAMLRLLALSEKGLPGYGSINLLHQKRVAGIVGCHLYVLDICPTETGLPEQEVQEELGHGALGKCHHFTFEIDDGPNVLGGNDAVGAPGLIKRHHTCIRLFRIEMRQHVVDRGAAHVDLPDKQRRVQGLMDRHVDQLDLDTFMAKRPFSWATNSGPKPTQML